MPAFNYRSGPSRVSKKTVLSLCVAVPALMSTQPLAAQESRALEEVIVTAQKREQRVFDVPFSVSAMTGKEIAERGISNLIDAQHAISSLTLTEFAPGRQRAQLRGTGTAGGATGLATVGFYLDEVPLVAGVGGAGPDVRLLDMARIEVLRGPQPTLYGESSMGGTVRYITADPNLEGFSGELTGSYGSVEDGDDSYRVSGVVNIPLIENQLGIRFAASEEQLGGWIDLASGSDEDINESTFTTFRAKALWTPTEAFRASLMYMTQDQDQDYQNFGDADRRDTNTGFPTLNNNEYDIANLVASYDFDGFTVLGTIGYLDRKDSVAFDLTAFGVPFFEAPPPFGFGLPPGTFTGVGLTQDSDNETWSQEIRISSNWDRKLNYTLGYYHRTVKIDTSGQTVTTPVAVQDILGFDPFAGGPTSQESDAFAVFGDIRYTFNEQWELTVGVRYYEDERDLNAALAPNRNETFDTTNPSVNLVWTPTEDSKYYVNAGKGFRSGGFNNLIPGFDIPNDFDPEEFYSYELGTKQQLMEGRLSFEAAVFYNEWEDIQAPSPAGAVPFFTNAGKASGPGVDLSLTALLSEEFSLSATYGWTDMEYDENSGDRLKGDPLDLVTDQTFSASLAWDRSLSSGLDLSARLDYQYTDGFTLTLRSPPFNQQEDSDSRDIINLRVGAEYKNYAAFVYANNLTDDDGTIYPIIGSNLEPVLSTPRTVGVELRLSF